MHKDLDTAFNKLIAMLKTDERCLGGWHFGSVGRGTTDEYSDHDPVFLVKGKDLEAFAADIPKLLTDISDEVVVSFDEGFNNGRFKCFCYAIRIGAEIHQFDVFIMNSDETEDWMCKLHLTGCTEEQIIFDRAGETAALLARGLSIEKNIPDTAKIIDTYWFHVIMLIKYFKRGDVFKIIKNMDFLFKAHTDLLFAKYDTLNWGGWESKVKHCVPAEKQEHLKAYFTSADLHSLEAAIKKAIELFEKDASEICGNYPKSKAQQIKAYFYAKLNNSEAH